MKEAELNNLEEFIPNLVHRRFKIEKTEGSISWSSFEK